jgi:muramoyltetrapeptide carboxypeptidase
VEGILSGGNLKVWTSLIGTGFLPRSGPPILFLEEISETLSRIDQLFFQLAHSGGLEGVRAVVLGDFTNCKDPAPTGHLNAKAKKQVPLRAEIPVWTAVKEILLPYSKKYGFVVARGLPVGHGPGRASLPIGARYRLTPAGTFELLDWDWIR